MHQDSPQLQTYQILFNDQNKVPKIVIFWNHPDWYLGAWRPKIVHFSEIRLSHIFPLDRNNINNLGPKSQPSKTILTLRRDASTWKAIYGMHRCPEQTNRENEKNLIVMSCTWKIRSSLNKNQKKCWENDKKLQKHKSFLLLQGFTLQSR